VVSALQSDAFAALRPYDPSVRRAEVELASHRPGGTEAWHRVGLAVPQLAVFLGGLDERNTVKRLAAGKVGFVAATGGEGEVAR
jgi:hypothetical protein